jgi:putative Holliday junction resolvase
MKVIALDLGDVWTGSALSDALKIVAKPYKTVKTTQLYEFLDTVLAQEKIDTILIGYPRTMKDTQSAQTKKVLEQKESIEKKYTNVKILLWDERLSSKIAKQIQGKKAKHDHAQHEHSIAAAVILQTYLEFLGYSTIP